MIAALVYEMASVPRVQWLDRLAGMHWYICVMNMVILSLPITAALLVGLRLWCTDAPGAGRRRGRTAGRCDRRQHLHFALPGQFPDVRRGLVHACHRHRNRHRRAGRVALVALVSGARRRDNRLPAMNDSAQNPAPAKGPAVWLGLDQRELDDAYDQIKYAPNLPQVVGRYRTNSDVMRARIGAPKRLNYGTAPIEGADLYATETAECADQHFHSWRRVARPARGILRFSGRDVCRCRRAFYRDRFQQCDGD